MQKISSYLYPNRVQLLADLAGFNVEYTNVYQRIVKIYKGVDNIVEFDIKNADQKRIELVTTPVITDLVLNVMDAMGNGIGTYDITPTDVKGIAAATIPVDDLADLSHQFLNFSVTATKDNAQVLLYGDTRFGALGKMELVGPAVPTLRPARLYDTFTADIDLKGHPTWHSSAIPATFYEAVKTPALNFDITVTGFVGSIWIEGTKRSTINVEAFKAGDFIPVHTYYANDPSGEQESIPTITVNVGDYKYFRVSYTTPNANGVGASFSVALNEGTYEVSLRAGGTGYAVGSQIKVLGSTLGGTDGINDLVITVTGTDSATSTNVASYNQSSISSFNISGTAANGDGTYVVTGKNITGTVDSIVVS